MQVRRKTVVSALKNDSCASREMYCGVMHIIHSVSHLGLDLNDLGAGLVGDVVGRDVADGLICKNKQTTSSARRTCVKIFYGESSEG